jgi:integrase
MIIEDLNKMVEAASDDTIARTFLVWKEDIVGSALLQEIIIKDITLGIKKPKSHVIKTKRGVTTDRETLNRIKSGIHKHVESEYDAKIIVCLLELLYYTGMRPAEAEALTKDDIKEDYISITKELGSSMVRERVVRRCKTENSIRNVPIHPELRPILDDLLSFALYDELFRRENGVYMTSDWAGRAIRRLCIKEGLEFNLYRLRHNMATSLVTNKVDTRTTMELLGHANYDMSIYYASSNDELKEEAINLVS